MIPKNKVKLLLKSQYKAQAQNSQANINLANKIDRKHSS